MDVFEKIGLALTEADEKTLLEGIECALKKGHSPMDVIDKGLVAGMAKVSKICEDKLIVIPEMLKIASAYTEGWNKLLAMVDTYDGEPAGKVIVGCVKDDLHDFGKNLMVLILKRKGFEVVDLGIDVDDFVFFDACTDENADFVCMNVTLSTKRVRIQEVVDRFKDCGCQKRLVIGGAGVDAEFMSDYEVLFYEDDPYKAADRMYELLMKRDEVR